MHPYFTSEKYIPCKMPIICVLDFLFGFLMVLNLQRVSASHLICHNGDRGDFLGLCTKIEQIQKTVWETQIIHLGLFLNRNIMHQMIFRPIQQYKSKIIFEIF